MKPFRESPFTTGATSSLCWAPREFDATVPPHFYGEISKTDLGCRVMNEKGHFAEFAQFIRQHGLENEDSDLIMKLKSILWAVVCALLEYFTAYIKLFRVILGLLKVVSCFWRKKRLSHQYW